jgi:hypothetical protein
MRLSLEHRQKLSLERSELSLLAKEIRLVRGQEINGLVPLIDGAGAESQVMMILSEARKL